MDRGLLCPSKLVSSVDGLTMDVFHRLLISCLALPAHQIDELRILVLLIEIILNDDLVDDDREYYGSDKENINSE